MKKLGIFLSMLLAAKLSAGQKITDIYFNLYTDSLKKGFYNYISVDGKYTDGRWQPLDSTQLCFTSNTGYFKGNDLFIDSSYTGATVKVKAVLKNDPSIWKETTIYIRKRPFTEPLPTKDDVLSTRREKKKNKKEKNED